MRLPRLGSSLAIAIGCPLLVALVGYGDFREGHEDSMLLFYMVPIAIATWYRGIALGLVMVLALMVRNLWQFRMRSAARAAGEKIMHPFTKQPVSNLTAEMAMSHFGGMQTLRLRREDVWVRLPQKVSTTARQILGYLGIPEAVFWTPPPPKMKILTI